MSTKIRTLKAIVEQTDGTKVNVTLKSIAYGPRLATNLHRITKAKENDLDIPSTRTL